LDKVLYYLVYIYVKVGLHLFYKKVEVKGLDNIPKKEAVLFVANHQNAMMDPILVATHNTRILYFLARASAFKNKIAAKLLNAIHAIAIYRVRDGVNSRQLNIKVFEKCVALLSKNKSILIFPEGSHNIKRQIRSLRSGFSQISYNFLTKFPNHQLYIVPVGLNFKNTLCYPDEVAMFYGKKINVNNYYEENYKKFTGKIIKKVSDSLKELTVNVPNDNYNKMISVLNEEEFLTPNKTNTKIAKFNKINYSENNQEKQRKRNLFYKIMYVNTISAFLFWNWLNPKIKEKEFISTAKFSIGLTVFPMVYLIKAILLTIVFNFTIGLLYFLFSIFIVFLSTKTN
jgi:1-acyl-sn-glycerol-3-phosphate acyltransferase